MNNNQQLKFHIMKKISTTLCMLALSSMMLNAAAVKNETTSVEYNTLAEAWDAAAESGAVIILNEDVEISGMLQAGEKAFTIKGNGHKISKSTSFPNNAQMFRTNNAKGSISMENLTIDALNKESNQSCFESSSNSTLTLNDVTIINYTTTQAQGVISVKNGGKLNATNLSIINSTIPDGRGDIFTGSNGVSLNGTCTASVYAEKQFSFNCSGLTGGKITVMVNNDRDLTNPIITGATNSDLFVVGNSNYMFELTDGNLTVKEKANDPTKAIFNLNKQKDYTDLLEAWNDAATGDVIFLNENATLTDRLEGKGRILTLKGNGNKIVRAENYGNDRLMILTNIGTGNITLENVIIDGGSTSNKKPVVETSNGSTLNLNDVTFQNCATTSDQGVICVKNNGKLNLNNVVIKDSDLPAGAGDVFAGSNTVKVAGNCTFSIFLQNNNYFTATDLTEGLVTILFDTAGTRDLATTPFVMGNDNTALFKSGDSNYDLKASEGNILLEKNDLSSVVEGISTDEAQVVDVYSIQGVRVKAGVAAAEATEGLPAGLYIVGGKKVIVK